MKKLTIKLKQHTPMIHFQHDQEGATLRASEVKPKLDRFILMKLGDENYDLISDDEYEEVASSFESSKENKEKVLFDDLSQKSQAYEVGKYLARKKGWLIGKGDRYALNYKIRIQIEEPSNREEFLLASYINQRGVQQLQRNGINVISNTPYFAQEQDNKQIINSHNISEDWDKIAKKAIIEKGNINISLICFDKKIEKEMFDLIANHIQSFFIFTNFGTRQSKGFGCFSVIEVYHNDHRLPLNDNEELLKKNFIFVYKKDERIQGNLPIQVFSNIFKIINDDYKLIKSGKSIGGYAKSKLMLYFKKDDIRWDKKFIKDVFNRSEGNHYNLKSEHTSDHQDKELDYRYCRALLGLAEQFEFLLENQSSNKMVVKVNNSEIQRYQSPLLFKVIGKDIYLVGNEIEPQILNKTFKFDMTVQKDNNWKESEKIVTPRKFNLKQFIHFAMEDKTNNASLNYIRIK